MAHNERDASTSANLKNNPTPENKSGNIPASNQNWEKMRLDQIRNRSMDKGRHLYINYQVEINTIANIY